ncbi:MAG: acyl-CoA dehydrogenase family protein [Thaumarchaeota archaeon]|nr:acyl-CoA dehydrogenase family protein [Nitrososphaerota archaeon]
MSILIDEQKRILEMLYPSSHQEYETVLEVIAAFIEKEVHPRADETDRSAVFPRRSVEGLFELGFTRISFPKKYGGLELPSVVCVAAMELVAKGCASTALSTSIHGTVCEGLLIFGSHEQREEHLGKLIAGEELASFALTEAHSGSDAKSMRTKAEPKGDSFVLNGSKMFITNAGEADLYFVFARTDKGPSAFLVPKDVDGLKFGKELSKIGMRGSPLREVIFEDCIVPAGNLVGEEGKGFDYAKRMLHGGRITVAAIALGIAQGAFEQSLKYSKEREAFGQPIAGFQMTQMKMADTATSINAGRLLTSYAAYLKDSGVDFESAAAQAKLFSSETALKACDEAIQIHGGYGYTDGLGVHRHWRDAKLTTIGEGTSEILRVIIAKNLLESSSS